MNLRSAAKKRMQLSGIILLAFVPHDSSSNLVALRIDGNETNCCLYNLRWSHRSSMARQWLAPGGGGKYSRRAVLHYKVGAEVDRYPSIESAAEALNIHRQAVTRYAAAGKHVRGGQLLFPSPPCKRGEVW